MKEYSINCAGLSTPEELHALLAKQLELPHDYDHTLDALYDCLRQISHETHITVFGLDALDFAEEFRTSLLDAEGDNFWLNISIP